MDSFTLRKIEFDEVRRILRGFCSSSPGKSLAVKIAPSRNPQTVKHWLDQTSQMVCAIRDVGLPPFGGATDIGGSLARAKPGGGAGGEDFVRIASALEAAANIRDYLNSLPEKLEGLRKLTEGISTFEAEVKAIRSIVDGDGTVCPTPPMRSASRWRGPAAYAPWGAAIRPAWNPSRAIGDGFSTSWRRLSWSLIEQRRVSSP